MHEIHKQDRLLKKLLPPQEIQTDATYKYSCFAIPFLSNGRPCLFSTLTKQGFELSETIDLTRRFSCSDIKNNTELFALMRGYFLVPADTDENELYLTVSNMMRLYFRKGGISSYTILPTLACNARCVYCYEAGLKPVSMTEQTAKDTIAFIERTRIKDGPLLLTWFGGEPLLGERIIDVIVNGVKNNGADFRSNIITNGSLIDERLAEKMVKEWNLISAQITIDGPEEEYKKRKRYIRYEDTYNKVFNAIRLLQQHGVKIDVRVNVDEDNFDSIPKLMEDAVRMLPQKEGIKIYFAPLDQVRATESVLELRRRIEEMNKLLPEAGFQEIAPGRPRMNFRIYRCMADGAESNVVILPDGCLNPCLQCEDVSSYGNIRDGITKADVYEKFISTGPVREMCRDCAFLPDCTAFAYCPVPDKCCKERRMGEAMRYLPEMAADAERAGAPIEEGKNPEELGAIEKAKQITEDE